VVVAYFLGPPCIGLAVKSERKHLKIKFNENQQNKLEIHKQINIIDFDNLASYSLQFIHVTVFLKNLRIILL